MPEFRAFAVFQRFLIQISERFVHCADRASNFPLWNSVERGPEFIAVEKSNANLATTEPFQAFARFGEHDREWPTGSSARISAAFWSIRPLLAPWNQGLLRSIFC